MIIVEDGTNVPGANSYVDVFALEEAAAERGVTLPATEEGREVLLHRAMDYLDTLSGRFPGHPTFTDQRLPFPRTIFERYRTSDLGVPEALKKAQLIAALAAVNGPLVGATSVSSASSVTRKTVGPVTVEYSPAASGESSVSYIPQVMALLRGILGAGSGQPAVVRG